MSLADMAARLKAQKQDEPMPIHWIEVPGLPRVVHISEVPELWDAQFDRDLRLAKETIGTHRAITLLTLGASLTVLAFEVPPQATFVFLIYGIQSAEAWFEAADTRRRLRSDRPGYFRRCSMECRHAFWVGSHPSSKLWRTWTLSGSWVVLFILQWFTPFEASLDRAALVKASVWQGEVWRLLTGPMLHGNLWHILMNLTAGIPLALLIERIAHPHLLVPLWLVGAVGGSLFSLAFLPEATSVGASGGLMAFVGFLGVMGWRRKALLPPRFGANILRSLAFMGLFGLLAWSVIDNAAHVGGALAGALLGLWIFRQGVGNLPLPDSRRRMVLGWTGVTAFLVLLAFTFWRLRVSR